VEEVLRGKLNAQVPSSKFQTNFKEENAKVQTEKRIEILDFEICLELGAWDLRFLCE
jgi:hypothetical protein